MPKMTKTLHWGPSPDTGWSLAVHLQGIYVQNTALNPIAGIESWKDPKFVNPFLDMLSLWGFTFVGVPSEYGRG